MIETEVVIKIAIAFFIFSFAYTTIKAVVTGVKEGIQNTRDILTGTSYEEIKERDKKKKQAEMEKHHRKMHSKLYRVTHPRECFNCMIIKKIKERAW